MKKNEFGTPLDRNGYAPSIIPDHDEQRCWLCGRNGAADPLNRHEVFGGANRNKSKQYGLWVHLCHWSCHQGPNAIHSRSDLANRLKEVAQRKAMEAYDWTVDDFRSIFHTNYIDEE